MKPKIEFFTTEGHLNEEGIALWVDALAESRTNKLPEEVSDHVERCLQCKAIIIEIRQMKREFKLPEVVPVAALEGKKRYLYSKTSNLTRIAAAAVILIAVGAALSLFIFNRQNNPDKLFAQNFTPYPDLITEKGTTWDEDTTRQLLYTGLNYYRKEQYDSAVLVFKHLFHKYSSSDTIAFYLANSYLATKQPPDEAIEILTSLSGKEPFTDQARWYLALAFLKKHNVKVAKEQLLILISTSDDYQKKARVLLDEIE